MLLLSVTVWYSAIWHLVWLRSLRGNQAESLEVEERERAQREYNHSNPLNTLPAKRRQREDKEKTKRRQREDKEKTKRRQREDKEKTKRRQREDKEKTKRRQREDKEKTKRRQAAMYTKYV